MQDMAGNTSRINNLASKLGVDIVGIAPLDRIKNGLQTDLNSFLFQNYKYAIVLGAQYHKLGKNAGGDETSLFLEEVAFKIMLHISEEENHSALIIHTEDEFEPKKRMGLLPLKALANEAGIGWQGRSLLIISPEYGPLHRLIAILTDTPLLTNEILENNCKDCTLCIDKCPQNVLKYCNFKNHPSKREDVLDLEQCNGDDGCKVCIVVCPWLKK